MKLVSSFQNLSDRALKTWRVTSIFQTNISFPYIFSSIRNKKHQQASICVYLPVGPNLPTLNKTYFSFTVQLTKKKTKWAIMKILKKWTKRRIIKLYEDYTIRSGYKIPRNYCFINFKCMGTTSYAKPNCQW